MIDRSQLLRLLGLTQIAIDRVEVTDADVLGESCARHRRRRAVPPPRPTHHWILRKSESDLSAEERRIRARLFAHSPQLAQAHALGQALADVYDMPLSKGQAKRKLGGWMRRVKNAEGTCFQSFLKTLRRLWDEITDYSTERPNSAFVEGLNNTINVLKRRCDGLSNLSRLYQRVYLDLCGYRLFAR